MEENNFDNKKNNDAQENINVNNDLKNTKSKNSKFIIFSVIGVVVIAIIVGVCLALGLFYSKESESDDSAVADKKFYDDGNELATCSLFIKGIKDDEKENTFKIDKDNNKVIVGITVSHAETFGIGEEETYNEKIEYEISEPGTYQINGYVKNVDGIKSYCKTPEFTVEDNNDKESVVTPVSCNLYIKGISVDLDKQIYKFYKDGNEEKLTIGITTSNNVDSFGIGTSENYDGNKEYVITKPGTYMIYGYVKGNDGTKIRCSTPKFTIVESEKEEIQPASCNLSIIAVKDESGDNTYKTFKDGNEEKVIVRIHPSDNATSFGIGTSENYDGNKEYVITKSGTYKIKGYVTNKNGVKSFCSTPEFVVISNELDTPLSCDIRIIGLIVDSNNNKFKLYEEGNEKKLVFEMIPSSNATSFGIGTSENYDGNKKYVVNKPGTYKIYGYVKNEDGYRAYCQSPEIIVVE